jgi:hypothetical protein
MLRLLTPHGCNRLKVVPRVTLDYTAVPMGVRNPRFGKTVRFTADEQEAIDREAKKLSREFRVPVTPSEVIRRAVRDGLGLPTPVADKSRSD